MKKVVLLCAAGMSTSLLVNKMREAASEMNLEYDINAYPVVSAPEHQDASIILLGPQVRFQLDKVKGECPGTIVESIDMQAYGMVDGRKVVEHVAEMIGE